MNKDTLTKQYIKDRKVFASAFNYFLYGGRQVIRPEQLQVVDTTEVVVPYGEDETGIKIQPVQKIRDAFFSVMRDGNKVFMLCGLENQSHPDNAIPVRNALYDIMEYSSQVQEAAKAHRDARNYGEGHDFLSGFHKTDKLIPVYTLVIYWNSDGWDAPRSLFEMLDLKDESDYYGLNDWKINLIIPNEITEEEAIQKFGSELGKALIYVKNMGNPEELERICRDDRFRVLETETALVLNEIMNANLEIKEGRQVVDMCAGIEGLKKKATLEGRSEALQKTAQRLFAKHNSVEDIADTLEVDVEVVEEWLGLVKA